MEPNLAAVRCKQILLKKLSYAVVSSVFSQVFILVIFLFLVNFNLIHPKDWIKSTLSIFLSISTWLFLIPFSAIVFSQSAICAKDYVLQSNCCTTRFQKIFEILSTRNFVLLVLHVVTGGLQVWLYVSLGRLYEDAPYDCKGKSCVRQQHVFLIASGMFTGFYFFVRVYVKDKKLDFPVIQQSKFLQVKGNVLYLLDKARRRSTWPTLYFISFYYFCTYYFSNSMIGDRDSPLTENTIGFLTCFYAWILGAIYFFNMNLMRFLFNMFLTEPIEFPLEKTQEVLTLQEAISSDNLPLVQHLACLDLYLLSFWSQERRQVLFSLSHPGCHPYNWNNLIENVLKLFDEYIDCLNKSIDALSPVKKQKPKTESVIVTKPAPVVQSPLLSPGKYPNMRNMSLRLTEQPEIISYSQQTVITPELQETLRSKIEEKLNSTLASLKRRLGYDYLFEELPEANIQKCLNYGQIIIWTSQGIAQIATASFQEDKYGVVQKQLPMLLTTLTGLKQATEKLNMVPAFSRRRGQNSYNFKMKLAVLNAVKRSLVNLSRTFGSYFGGMPLTKDVQQQLQCFAPARSG